MYSYTRNGVPGGYWWVILIVVAVLVCMIFGSAALLARSRKIGFG